MRDHLVLVFLSDTHLLERELAVPHGDLLVHCGDASFMGADNVVEFDHWLGEQPHRYKVCVGGNHDRALADGDKLRNAILLTNEGVDIEGLRLWGTPITCVGPAFRVSSAEERRRIFSTIPDDTDILISHAPPYGVLDCPPGTNHHSGDPELRAAVDRVQPLISCYGHIHCGPRTEAIGDTLAINASLLGPDGALRGQPVVVKLPRR